MDHSYYRDKISAYVDNELSPQEREVVQQHLDECEECRNLLAELEKLDRFVQQRSQLAGEEYWEQSAQKIEQRLGFTGETKVTDITPSRWKGLVPKLAAVVASIAVLGFIALYERDISRQISPPAMKATEAPQIELDMKPPPAVEKDFSEMSAPKEIEADAAPVSVEEPAKKREQAKLGADKADVSIKPDAITPTDERKAEVRETVADKAEIPPVQETVNEMPRKVEGVVAGQSGQVTGTLGTGKLDYYSKGTETVSVVREEELVISADELSRPTKPEVSKESRESFKLQSPVAVSMAKSVSAVDSDLVLPEDWLQDGSLEQWRHRRDSLQTLYAELTSPHRALSEAKSRQREGQPSIEEVEGQLLYSYYQIARFTQDEKERAAVVSYLTDYAQKAESRYKDLALSYLEELTQSEK
jgi:hypothetical protein